MNALDLAFAASFVWGMRAERAKEQLFVGSIFWDQRLSSAGAFGHVDGSTLWFHIDYKNQWPEIGPRAHLGALAAPILKLGFSR